MHSAYNSSLLCSNFGLSEKEIAYLLDFECFGTEIETVMTYNINYMKNNLLFTLGFLILCSTHVYAQDYDLNTYDFRYQKYRGLSLDFDLGSNGRQSFYSTQDTFARDSTFFNSRRNSSSFNISPSYFSFTNTDALQRTVRASFQGDFNFDSDKIVRTYGRASNRSMDNELALSYSNTSRFYSGDKFKYFQVSTRSGFDNMGRRQKNKNDLNEEMKDWSIDNSTSVSYGFGRGRINNVTDAVQSMFILKDLEKLSGKSYTNEQVEAVAQGITLIRNNRYLDFRIGYKTQLKMLDSVLQANGVSKEKSIDYFTTISDNWLYANRANRSSGSSWTHYATLSNRFGYGVTNREFNLLSNPRYEYRREQQLNPSVSINTGYAYSYQQSLYVQTSYSFTASTGLDYAINFNDDAYENEPIEDEDLELTYYETVRWISSLRGNYQYLYQANTRNLLTVNVSPFVQIERDIPQYMTPAISGLKAYGISPNIGANANYYHWFSPHLNINASGFLSTNGRYALDQNDVRYQKSQGTSINYDLRVGINYQLF